MSHDSCFTKVGFFYNPSSRASAYIFISFSYPPTNLNKMTNFAFHKSARMTFEELNLNRSLLNALDDLGLEEATPIQEKVFSPIMAGKNVVGIAQTGTGKTFAFLLPALRLWKFSKSPLPQILILVPTRELVMQITQEIEKLTTYMNVVTVGVYGGTNIRTHKSGVANGCDIVVGTPGRVMDLMADRVLKTKNIDRVIIDEVDEMLHLGFRTQLNTIVELLPKKRQHLMFSATITDEVEEVIGLFTNHYEKIEAAASGTPLANIQQYGFEVPNFNSKANLLELLLKEDDDLKKVLVFVETKKMADVLYERMEPVFEGVTGVIHSSKSQNYRFGAVEKFQDGTFRILITTDLIARGLDVASVTHVFNFNLPDTPEQYIHRIGRTGRAKEKGISISFISEAEEYYKMAIEELMQSEINLLNLPKDLILSEELIDLEKQIEQIPFVNHKFKAPYAPTGPAFHEKSDKNKKVNNKIRKEEKMMLKHGKKQTRGDKYKKKD